MNLWVERVRLLGSQDTEYTKKYGELILYNMLQELEYLRLIYFEKNIDYSNEINHVIELYSIDTEMCKLMETPKYKKCIKDYYTNRNVLGNPMPLFGMECFYDGKTVSEVEVILKKHEALKAALLD